VQEQLIIGLLQSALRTVVVRMNLVELWSDF